MLFIVVILTLTVACNSTQDPKEKVIPADAVVEEDHSPESKSNTVAEEVLDKTATIEAELAALEATLQVEASSRSRSATAVESDPETPVEKCMRRCELIQDNMQYVTQSGDTVNEYNECVSNCQELANLCDEFQECIQNAATEEEKNACRQHYMDNRPWSHTE